MMGYVKMYKLLYVRNLTYVSNCSIISYCMISLHHNVSWHICQCLANIHMWSYAACINDLVYYRYSQLHSKPYVRNPWNVPNLTLMLPCREFTDIMLLHMCWWNCILYIFAPIWLWCIIAPLLDTTSEESMECPQFNICVQLCNFGNNSLPSQFWPIYSYTIICISSLMSIHPHGHLHPIHWYIHLCIFSTFHLTPWRHFDLSPSSATAEILIHPKLSSIAVHYPPSNISHPSI